MKFALHFGNISFPKPDDAKHAAILAEKVGFESIIAVEHVVIPTHYETVYPYGPTGKLPGGIDMAWPDPLAWLTFVGAVTTKLRLLTGVLVLPQRNPLVLAKHLATIDVLTGGRMELGIGVGWLKEEFNAIGIPFMRRGARVDEYVRAMRVLWEADDVSFTGEFVEFDRVSCNPKPLQGRVPIIVGGHTKPAIRRAATLGDGFFPATGAADVNLASVIAQMRDMAADAERDAAAIQVTSGCPDALPGSGKDPLAAIAQRAAIGVDRIAVPIAAFGEDLDAMLSEFGETVIENFTN